MDNLQTLPIQRPASITLQIFDVLPNPTIAENLEYLVRKLNQITNSNRFSSKGYQTRYYIPEIQEFVVIVNDQHILCNENKFKLSSKLLTDPSELEDVARYFQKCLEVGCGIL